MKERLKALIRTDKLGTIILIFSLSFSIILCSIGGVLLSNRRGRKSDAKSSSNKTETSLTSYTLYPGSNRTIYAKSGEYYELHYTPSYSGNHIIKLNGAYIKEVRTSAGTYIHCNTDAYSYSYDYAYTINMDSYTSYVIKIYATDSYVEVLPD